MLFFFFSPEVKYQYVRLRMTDYIHGSSWHGMYITWLEFFTSSTKELYQLQSVEQHKKENNASIK